MEPTHGIEIHRAAAIVGVVLLTFACNWDKKAGRAASGAARCAEFCRLVVRPPDRAASAECQRSCLAEWALAGESCQKSLREWMNCATSLASGRLSSDCSAERRSARECVRDCGQSGIVQSGEERVELDGNPALVGFQLRFHGCATCVPEPGAGARAVCSAPKVCEETCLECGSSKGSISLRACVEGRCAGKSELAGIARKLDALRSCAARQ